MTLINSTLFLGFSVDEAFASALEKHKPEYISLFIHSRDAYLEEVHFQGVRYLGKYMNNEEPLIQLELLEANIFSILKKLVPDYDYSGSNLILFALPQKAFNLTSPHFSP